MTTEQLPELLDVAVSHIEELGSIIAARYADHTGKVHPSRLDRVPREVETCNAAIEAIRAEHQQRVTMQRRVDDQAQRIADLETKCDDLAARATVLIVERDELRARLDASKTERASLMQNMENIYAENKDLRARLDAAAGQEPVAEIRTWHKSNGQHADLIDWCDAIENLPDGEHLLYAAPAPAQAAPEEWRPIAAEPADGGLYWVLIGDQPHVARFSNRTSTARWWSAYGIPRAVAEEPTHWMPIPDAPEAAR